MSTVIVKGAKTAAAETKKAARTVTPKLVCIITGQSRFTNKEYLDAKAANAGSLKRFLSHYVCSDAMKLLREGKSLTEIRTALKVKPEDIKDLATPTVEILKVAQDINGKRAKKATAKKADAKKGDAKPKTPAAPKTPKAPKAPKAPKEKPAAEPDGATATKAPVAATPAAPEAKTETKAVEPAAS